MFHYANRSMYFFSAACLLMLSVTACKSPQVPQAQAPQAQASDTSTAASNAKSPIDPKQLNVVIAQYKTYVQQEVDQMVEKNKAFTGAIIAGDLETSQKLYASTRTHYERVEPIAELFSDLDGSMDAREDDFAKKANDPNFTGYHRIEKALFVDKTTEGMKSIAEKLMQDSLKLQKEIAGLKIEPKNMVGGAATLMEEVASKKVTGEEDRYGHTDLWDFKANLEGSEKIVALLRPMIQRNDPTLLSRIDNSFQQLNDGLSKYRDPNGGFVSYNNLTDDDRKTLKTVATAHAEDLSKLRGTLGVD